MIADEAIVNAMSQTTHTETAVTLTLSGIGYRIVTIH
jgi:hypothetical protein